MLLPVDFRYLNEFHFLMQVFVVSEMKGARLGKGQSTICSCLCGFIHGYNAPDFRRCCGKESRPSLPHSREGIGFVQQSKVRKKRLNNQTHTQRGAGLGSIDSVRIGDLGEAA